LEEFNKAITSHVDSKYVDGAHYWRGEIFYATEKYPEAIKEYQIVLDKFAQGNYGEKARYGLGWCYMKTKDYPKAITAFGKIISDNPKGDFTVESQLRIGDAFYAQENYPEAKNAYTKMIEMDTDNKNGYTDDAKYWLAWTLYKDKKYDDAIKEFEKVLAYQNFEFLPESQFQIAASHADLNQHQRAVEAYKKLLEKYPKSKLVPQALFGIGISYISLSEQEGKKDLSPQTKENLNNARDHFQRLVKEYPKENLAVDAQYIIGQCYFRLEQYEDSNRELKKFVDKNPKHELAGEAWYKIGFSYGQLKNWKDAVSAYDHVINNPKSKLIVDALYQKATSLYNLKKYDEAIKIDQRIIKEYPNNKNNLDVAALYDMAWIYDETKKVEQAFEAFKEIADKHPDKLVYWADAVYKVGEYYFKKKKFPEAVENFTKYVEKKKGSDLYDDAQYQIGTSQFEQKNYPAAEAAFKEVVVVPDSKLAESTHVKLGDIYFLGKRYDESLTEYNNAEKLKGEFLVDALLGRGKVFVMQGKNDEAITELSTLLKAHSTAHVVPEGQYYLSEAYWAKEDYMHALVEYRKVDVLYAKTDFAPRSLFRAGECYEKLNKPDKAKKIYQKFIKKYSKSPLLSQAEKKIGSL
jgi:TolA-binding protein